MIDLASQSDVPLGNATGIVGDESKQDPVVADVNVWVVAGSFGEVGYLIHKLHSSYEILEHPFADELTVLKFPLRIAS